ncbi:metallophosphoesterase family protein [Sphingomonas sp. MMS12-HWE2-04]|uniref:metallophosphoesterase family protein n=1 Tax=Sphingomonas sp. MMS12-HWE2-04 TaxID=3234199 RepID=UPI00384DF7DA
MISRLFSRRAPRGPKGSLPAGERIYAIGDIHGRLDLLDELLASIRADNLARGTNSGRIIFLGDLIDRGPQSAHVVARALEIKSDLPDTQFLMGNHEEVFLKALHGDLKALSFFARIGGRETILSYGLSDEEYRDADYPELLELLRARVPAEHIAFLESFEDLIVAGDYAFVHAGIRPGEPLALQKPGDLRWIRNEFLNHRAGFEKIIVHGHTITEEIDVQENRIGLDTGAYASGKLTAMGFEGTERWVLST